MTQTTTTADTIQSSIDAIRSLPETEGLSQKCWVQIEQDGTLSYQTQHQSVNGTSFHLYHGVGRTITLPSGAIPAKVAACLTQYRELVQAVVDGMDTEWDGSNAVGTLTNGASEALGTLNNLGSGHVMDGGWFDYEAGDIVTEWEAAEWLNPMNDQFATAPSIEAAETLAADAANNGEVMADPNGRGRIVVDLERAKAYARQEWEATRADAE